MQRNVKQLEAIAQLGLEGEIVVQYFHSLSSWNSSSALSLLCSYFVILYLPSCLHSNAAIASDLVKSDEEFLLSLFELNEETSFPECSFVRVERSFGIERLPLLVIVRVKVTLWPFYPKEDSMYHDTH